MGLCEVKQAVQLKKRALFDLLKRDKRVKQIGQWRIKGKGNEENPKERAIGGIV